MCLYGELAVGSRAAKETSMSQWELLPSGTRAFCEGGLVGLISESDISLHQQRTTNVGAPAGVGEERWKEGP